MWSTQRLDNGDQYIPEVTRCADDIIDLAQEIVSSGHRERKFIVFPLFMAGFSSRSPVDRQEALDLLYAMEQDSIGKSFSAVRELLEITYERQDECMMRVGNSLDVDWLQIIAERGLQVVSARL